MASACAIWCGAAAYIAAPSNSPSAAICRIYLRGAFPAQNARKPFFLPRAGAPIVDR